MTPVTACHYAAPAHPEVRACCSAASCYRRLRTSASSKSKALEGSSTAEDRSRRNPGACPSGARALRASIFLAASLQLPRASVSHRCDGGTCTSLCRRCLHRTSYNPDPHGAMRRGVAPPLCLDWFHLPKLRGNPLTARLILLAWEETFDESGQVILTQLNDAEAP